VPPPCLPHSNWLPTARSGPRHCWRSVTSGTSNGPRKPCPCWFPAPDHTGGDPLLEAAAHSHIVAMADMDPARVNRSAELAAAILERPGLTPDPDHLACVL